ncbi:hypothetical protein AAVH_16378 [Aphelenchoides avenae]|nr:hypothetical protein AAVH_16378 [Aphelenchus avenae]
MKLLYREQSPKLFGAGPILFEWRPGGNHVAVAGSNGLVRVYDRYGEPVDEFNVAGKVVALTWDKDGENLAVVNGKTDTIALYEMSTRNVDAMDLNMGTRATPTFAAWSPTAPVLVIGNNKGNIVIFNNRTSRKIPIMGKHQRAIITGAFGGDNLFALGSEDTSITVNNIDGDTVHTFSCSGEPEFLQFTRFRRVDDRPNDRSEDYISAVVGRKTLMIIKLSEPDTPINLQFQEKYGRIVSTNWFGNGSILVGFEHGFVVCLSAQKTSEVSQEIFSIQEFKSNLAQVTINMHTKKVFSVGDNQLKVRELEDLAELTDIVEVDSDDKGLSTVSACDDGSLAAVAGNSGSFCIYLTRLPVMGAAYRDRLAVLSSLTEITVFYEGETQPIASFNVKIEPSLITVGMRHIAVVLNNRAWFYEIRRNESILLFEFEYIATVVQMKMNREFVMAKLDQTAQLHKMETMLNATDDNSKLFPEQKLHSNYERLIDCDLMEKFFVYSSDSNHIRYFSLTDWTYVGDYKHNCEIRSVFGELDGIRLCFLDERFDAYIYSPVDDSLTKVPDVGSSLHYVSCLWETFTIDRDTFVIHDGTSLFAFVISKNTKGDFVLNHISTMRVPFGNYPLILSKGITYCHTHNGRVNTMLLKSHKTESNFEGKSHLEEMLQHSVTLKRWRHAWRLCDYAKDDNFWKIFSKAALTDMNVDLAIRIFRHIGDVGMVWALEEMQYVEEQNVLGGHMAALLGNFDQADELFSQSSQPTNALDMRRDVLHWDRALKLARETSPKDLPHISKEYAMQLEFVGQYDEALKYYEDAILDNKDESEEVAEHNWVCQSGIARMALRLGDIRRVFFWQFDEAGRVYEAGLFYDRAAAAFLKSKNWVKLSQVEKHVRSPKILTQYGKMLAHDKKYEQAYQAFERAKDYDNMIRMLLKHLNRVDEAVKIAQESRSVEGANLVARYFADIGNQESAVEFLVLSQCFKEAFDLALKTDNMNVYANAIEDAAGPAQYAELADYYNSRNNHLMTGKFFGLAEQYKLALEHLMKTGDNDEAIEYGIEFATKSKDKDLIQKLIDFLVGETDSIPKDPKHLFTLYVQLKMYPEAAKTAIIIAEEQQKRGYYRTAHDLLFGMYQSLTQHKIRIPAEVESNLMILHSYIIVKLLVKRGDNGRASRLLMRVSTNISRFPLHAVQILTSAVVTCSKAGLRASAFKFASQLLNPAYRSKIDEKYRRKIESVVRKSDQLTDVEEEKKPCPQCNVEIPEFDLTCNECKSSLPYCVVTGRHISNEDFATCPSCNFPGYFSEFNKLSAKQENCPMCGKSVAEVIPSSAKEYMATYREKGEHSASA